MVCRRYKERKNADFLRDSEGEPDLEKIYDFVYQRLGHKMRVTKSFYGYYFSDNVRVNIDDNISFRIVRDHKDALWLKRLDWHPAPDICKLLYNSDEQWVYFAYKDYIYELQITACLSRTPNKKSAYSAIPSFVTKPVCAPNSSPATKSQPSPEPNTTNPRSAKSSPPQLIRTKRCWSLKRWRRR